MRRQTCPRSGRRPGDNHAGSSPLLSSSLFCSFVPLGNFSCTLSVTCLSAILFRGTPGLFQVYLILESGVGFSLWRCIRLVSIFFAGRMGCPQNRKPSTRRQGICTGFTATGSQSALSPLPSPSREEIFSPPVDNPPKRIVLPHFGDPSSHQPEFLFLLIFLRLIS